MPAQKLLVTLEGPAPAASHPGLQGGQLVDKPELTPVWEGGKGLEKIGRLGHTHGHNHENTREQRTRRLAATRVRRVLQAIQMTAALVASMIYWGVGGLLFILAGLVLVPLLPGEKSRALGQWMLQGAFRCFLLLLRLFGALKCEFHGLEALRSARGGLIVAPNHPALWDAVIVISQIHGLRCILKASLLHNPFLAGGATLAGFIPNKPAHKMLQRSIEALRAGERLLFFPEGTRTRKAEGCVNAFLGGIGIIATQSGAPVWPVFIETNSDYLSKGWPLWWLPDKPVHVRVTVGEPLASPPDESAASFARRLEDTFKAALAPRQE
jgi:1-acyl-sn-glycerol-3-phosphate acyltransferase